MINVYISKLNNKDKKKTSKQILEYAFYDTFKIKIDFSKIHENKYGKPYYDNHIFYNISHSKNYIGIAISDKEIGFDIEEEHSSNIDISSKIIGPEEAIVDNNILNNWTIKECYAKYLGLGLNIDFKEIHTNNLLKDQRLKKIENQEFYCYLYGEGKINKIEYILL